MCNQPQRLSAALAPVRSVLLAQPPVSRWGLAYSQGGDMLLVRTPKSSSKPVDLAGPLAEIATDCAIGQAVHDDRYSGTDNTPPFRFRRWMFAMSNQPVLDAAAPRLLEHVPEYLRRNLRGKTPGELVFHVFLAMLHDEGIVDEPNIPVTHPRRALAATIKLVAAEQAKAGLPEGGLGNIVLSNGRSMIASHGPEAPLRLRRLWVLDDKGARDPGFRGYMLLSGGDGETKDGFEYVPQGAVLITRDLQVSFSDLNPTA
jgi:glutamine amidotransferase